MFRFEVDTLLQGISQRKRKGS
jgi:serine/threonine protein kinase